METFDTILNRRSIRSFNETHVSDEVVRHCLEAARWAPSGGNTQPWSYIVIRDREKMVRFDPYHHQPWVEKAPVCLVCCLDPTTKRKKYDESIENLFISYLDLGASIQNLILAAHDAGLGTVWVAAFSPKKVRELCAVPDHISIVSLVCLGYYDHEATTTFVDRDFSNRAARSRRPLASFCFNEQFGTPLQRQEP